MKMKATFDAGHEKRLFKNNKYSLSDLKSHLLPIIDSRCYLCIKLRWTLKLTTHVIAQPPRGQIVGLSPGSKPKRLQRETQNTVQVKVQVRVIVQSQLSPELNSRYAASLESFLCWSCRCCSRTCSSGELGRTSGQPGEEEQGDDFRI